MALSKINTNSITDANITTAKVTDDAITTAKVGLTFLMVQLHKMVLQTILLMIWLLVLQYQIKH